MKKFRTIILVFNSKRLTIINKKLAMPKDQFSFKYSIQPYHFKEWVLQFIRLLLLLMVSVAFYNCSRSDTNAFEGKVEYKVSVQRPANSQIPVKQFNAMFQETDSKAELFVRGNYYRLDQFSHDSNNSTLYLPDSHKVYTFSSTSPAIVFWSNANTDWYTKTISSVENGSSETVMKKKCKSIVINYKGGTTTQIFYSEDFSIDTCQVGNHRYGFLDYFYQTGALPLKIILSGGGALHEMVFEATNVNKESLRQDLFLLPKNVKYLNMDETQQ